MAINKKPTPYRGYLQCFFHDRRLTTAIISGKEFRFTGETNDIVVLATITREIEASLLADPFLTGVDTCIGFQKMYPHLPKLFDRETFGHHMDVEVKECP